MTEAEWLACEDPRPMLVKFKRRKTCERKLRLFACGCCRRFWHYLTEDACRRAVETAESFADSRCDIGALEQANSALPDYDPTSLPCTRSELLFRDLLKAVMMTTAPPGAIARKDSLIAFEVARFVSFETRIAAGHVQTGNDPFQFGDQAAEETAHATLLRDIFGNPFRPVTFDPAWRTRTAVSLAGQMYESRDFGAMPILADAIEDAGCASDDVLDHCRGPGPHVRGCWVVDLVLGKE